MERITRIFLALAFSVLLSIGICFASSVLCMGCCHCFFFLKNCENAIIRSGINEAHYKAYNNNSNNNKNWSEAASLTAQTQIRLPLKIQFILCMWKTTPNNFIFKREHFLSLHRNKSFSEPNLEISRHFSYFMFILYELCVTLIKHTGISRRAAFQASLKPIDTTVDILPTISNFLWASCKTHRFHLIPLTDLV